MLSKIAQNLNLPENMVRAALDVKNKLEAAGIENVVIGGIAIGKYSKPRSTSDIDFLVKEEDFSKLRDLFGAMQPLQINDRSGYGITIEGVDVDFIFANETEEQFLFTNKTDYNSLNIPNVLNMIYLKMKSGRVTDTNDVIQMCKKLSLKDRDDVVKFLKKRVKSGDIGDEAVDDFKNNCLIADLEEKNRKIANDLFNNYLKNTLKIS